MGLIKSQDPLNLGLGVKYRACQMGGRYEKFSTAGFADVWNHWQGM